MPSSYRDIIQKRFRELVAFNKAYSLRAFARDLKIAPSLLSDIMNGKRGISFERAYELAKDLKLQAGEAEFFVLLVELESTKSAEHRTKISKRIAELQTDLSTSTDIVEITLADFETISMWYYPALLELANSLGSNYSPGKAAGLLGLDGSEAQLATERLIRLGLLECENGHYRKRDQRLVASSALKNEALRAYHKALLRKFDESMDSNTTAKRFVGSETFAFDSESLPAAADIIENCFEQLIRLSSLSKSNLSIYSVGIQMMPLSTPIAD